MPYFTGYAFYTMDIHWLTIGRPLDNHWMPNRTEENKTEEITEYNINESKVSERKRLRHTALTAAMTIHE